MNHQPEQLLLPQRPLILGIAGCSGSGKTTLARELTQQLSATLLPLDFYYICLSHLPPPTNEPCRTSITPTHWSTRSSPGTSPTSPTAAPSSAPSTTSPPTPACETAPRP
jgi:GTPase SAR1 family protein